MELSELAHYLVGSDTFFKFKDGTSEDTAVYQSITKAEERITKELALLDRADWTTDERNFFLAQMYHYYYVNPYFASIRRHLKLGRSRKAIIDLLKEKPVDSQEKFIKAFYIMTLTDVNRKCVLIMLKYFLGVYPSRIKNFKPILSKDDFMYVV